MVTDSLIGVEDGEIRNGTITEESAAREVREMKEEPTEVIDVGIETGTSVRNESLHGSTSQQKRNRQQTRSIQRTTSRSGRNNNAHGSSATRLFKPLWPKSSLMSHHSSGWRSRRLKLLWR